jgi:hypothetical protein
MEDMPVLCDHLVFDPVNCQDRISYFPAGGRNIEKWARLRAVERPPANYAVPICQ